MWPRTFSNVDAHVSRATLKGRPLNWHPPQTHVLGRQCVSGPCSDLASTCDPITGGQLRVQAWRRCTEDASEIWSLRPHLEVVTTFFYQCVHTHTRVSSATSKDHLLNWCPPLNKKKKKKPQQKSRTDYKLLCSFWARNLPMIAADVWIQHWIKYCNIPSSNLTSFAKLCYDKL